MHVLKVFDEHDIFINCTDNENDIEIIIKYLVLSMPGSVFLLCLIGLINYTKNESLINE